MIISLIWTCLFGAIVWRVEVLYRLFLSKQEPLGQIQYKELNSKIIELKDQVTKIKTLVRIRDND